MVVRQSPNMGAAKKALAWNIILLTTITLLFVWYSAPKTEIKHSSWRVLRCYLASGNMVPELQEFEPEVGQSIFFHETSCPDKPGDFPLSHRQACAVESAAKTHPGTDIFVLFTTPVTVETNLTNNLGMKALLGYQNIKIRHINFKTYLENTPLHHLQGPLQSSGWPVSHASDILRYTTLYKYRGIYLDTDVMLLKHLPNFSNYVGAESPWSLGAGVISFGNDDVGSDMANSCTKEISKTFDPRAWGNNGPGVISRVLYRRCKVAKTIQLWGKQCQGFRIFSPSAFYAIPFSKNDLFFKPGYLEKVQKRLANSYLVHYWNRITSKMKISDPSIPFLVYAKQYCPKTYEIVKGNF